MKPQFQWRFDRFSLKQDWKFFAGVDEIARAAGARKIVCPEG
ncbi:MAG TPA: hypothetical protein VIF12_06010 [Micavibrio sp.]